MSTRIDLYVAQAQVAVVVSHHTPMADWLKRQLARLIPQVSQPQRSARNLAMVAVDKMQSPLEAAHELFSRVLTRSGRWGRRSLNVYLSSRYCALQATRVDAPASSPDDDLLIARSLMAQCDSAADRFHVKTLRYSGSLIAVGVDQGILDEIKQMARREGFTLNEVAPAWWPVFAQQLGAPEPAQSLLVMWREAPMVCEPADKVERYTCLWFDRVGGADRREGWRSLSVSPAVVNGHLEDDLAITQLVLDSSAGAAGYQDPSRLHRRVAGWDDLMAMQSVDPIEEIA